LELQHKGFKFHIFDNVSLTQCRFTVKIQAECDQISRLAEEQYAKEKGQPIKEQALDEVETRHLLDNLVRCSGLEAITYSALEKIVKENLYQEPSEAEINEENQNKF
jgi:hypothetical protein